MGNENLIARKYFRYNGATTISDPVAIRNLQISQQRDIIDNQKLGNYDKEGNYYISNEITKELLELNKRISEFRANDSLKNGKDVYRLYSQLPGFDKIEFILEVSKNTATLYLLEHNYKEGGQYFETDEVFLKDFSFEKEITFEDIKKLLKIDDDESNSGRFLNVEHLTNLFLRKIYLKLAANTLSEITVNLERESFEEMVSILKNSGEYGEKVLATFVERLGDRKEVVENKEYVGYNKALNDILFSAIELVTTEEDLKDSKTTSIYNSIFAIRNSKVEVAIAGSKMSVTPVSVKGKFFELTKQDLPIEVVSINHAEIESEKLVGHEIDREKVAEIKSIRERDIKEIIAKTDSKVEKTKISNQKQSDNNVIEAEKPAYIFKNVETSKISLTETEKFDRINQIIKSKEEVSVKSGNRVVENKEEKEDTFVSPKREKPSKNKVKENDSYTESSKQNASLAKTSKENVQTAKVQDSEPQTRVYAQQNNMVLEQKVTENHRESILSSDDPRRSETINRYFTPEKVAEIKTKSNEEVHRQADESIKPTYKEFVDKKFVDKELVNQTPVDEKEIQKDSLEDGISSLNENLLQNQAEATKNADAELLNILQSNEKKQQDKLKSYTAYGLEWVIKDQFKKQEEKELNQS